MKEVWINHKLVDFLNAIKQHKIRPGCGSPQEEESQQQQPPQQPQQHQPAQSHIMDDDSEGYVREHIAESDGEYVKFFSSSSSGGAISSPFVLDIAGAGAGAVALCFLITFL